MVAPGFTVDTVRTGPGQLDASWESLAGWLAGTDFQLYITGVEGILDTRLLSYYLPSQDGYFALLFAPPVEPGATVPRDVILVLDTSGSMEGAKLAQIQSAAADILTHLGSNDRFAIVSFAFQVTLFDASLRPPPTRAPASPTSTVSPPAARPTSPGPWSRSSSSPAASAPPRSSF